MTSYRTTGRKTSTIAAFAGVTLIAVGLAACGGSSGGSQAAVATPSGQSSTAAGSTSTPAAPSSPAADSSAAPTPAGTVPDYQPSTVVSKSGYSTVLSSPDSVDKIGAFYRDAVANGGWSVSSSSSSSYHASISGHRDGVWLSVSVYPTGSGSGISISTSKPAG